MVRRLTYRSPAHAPQRRLVWSVIVLGVLAMHGCIVQQVSERMAEADAEAAMPPRIEVAYVREMEMTEPAPVAPPPRRVSKPRRPRAPAKPPEPAASQAVAAQAPASQGREEPEPTAEAAPDLVAQAASMPELSEPLPDAASASAPAEAASAPASAASQAKPFEWPASTRLSYVLTGNYRGEVHGSAQVEWIRVADRYQVHVDVIVGMPFAPLLTRRTSSEGQLTDQGLSPERFDQDSKSAFRDRRRQTVLFERDTVLLANGQRRDRWPGLQDSASQFVQLAYVFTTRPELLTPGATVELPLALPNKVDRWTFDVLEAETLHTPFGSLVAVPLKPRRTAQAGGDLTAEIWFAPTLHYLPVRIRIRQDPETYVDLLIERKPQLAIQ